MPREPEPFVIEYVDRRTGALLRETVLGEAFVRWVYERFLGRALRRTLLTRPAFSRAYGRYQSSRLSRRAIPGVISKLRVDMEDYVVPEGGFSSFNDFFTRRLRSDARPVDADPSRLVAPADGRTFAYTDVREGTLIPAKGRRISLAELLQSDHETARYREGTVLVVRLCPSDYHRFHFPCAGVATRPRTLRGPLESVNPRALARGKAILDKNQRDLTFIDSDRFGRVAYLEIGAMCVGSIVHTYTPGRVAAGDEKGYFQFGGSTVILIFEADAVRVDDDLVQTTRRGLETFVRMGEGLGSATRP